MSLMTATRDTHRVPVIDTWSISSQMYVGNWAMLRAFSFDILIWCWPCARPLVAYKTC